MDQQIINLYDEYTHKPLSREVFLKKLITITGSLAVAMAILPSLEGNYAKAAVPADDDGLFTERVTYPTRTGNMKAYVARPKKDGKYAAVMVIHENRGLNAHIEDVARRAALAGYLAIAPDALSPLGGTPANEDEARELFGKLDAHQTIATCAKGFDYAGSRNDCNNKFGCVATQFCCIKHAVLKSTPLASNVSRTIRFTSIRIVSLTFIKNI